TFVAGQPPEAEAPAPPSRSQVYLDVLARARSAMQADQKPLAGAYLAMCPAEYRGWEWNYLKQVCRTGVPSLTMPAGGHRSAFSPDGWMFAADGPDNSIVFREAESGGAFGTLRGHHLPVRRLAYDSTGEQLASAAWDDKESEVKVWFPSQAQELFTLHLPGRL